MNAYADPEAVRRHLRAVEPAQHLDLHNMVLRGHVLASSTPPPRPWHIEGMIPGRTVTMLSGDGGLGKSTLALQLAVATVARQEWLRRSPPSGPALYLSAEDDADEVARRVAETATFYDLPDHALSDLHVLALADQEATLAVADGDGVMRATPLLDGLTELAVGVRPRLIVLDSLADVFAGSEIDRGHARQFVALLRRLAITTEAAVVMLSHPSLSGMASGSGMSGSTHWNNSVRSRLYLAKPKVDDTGSPPDPDARVLSLMKANYAAPMGDLRLKRRGGGYDLEDGEMLPTLDRVAAQAKADGIFLKLATDYAVQGRHVSSRHGPNYAPAVFATEPLAKGMAKAGLTAAMNRLMAAGALREEPYGPPSKQRHRLVLIDEIRRK